MTRRIFCGLVLLVLALGTANALPYSASSPVVDLTPSNFETKIKNSGLMLVEVDRQCLRLNLCLSMSTGLTQCPPINDVVLRALVWALQGAHSRV